MNRQQLAQILINLTPHQQRIVKDIITISRERRQRETEIKEDIYKIHRVCKNPVHSLNVYFY